MKLDPEMIHRPFEEGSKAPNGSSWVLQDASPVDASFVRNAVDKAAVNALRMALYQVTDDPALAMMKIHKVAIRGGVLFDYVLDPKDEALVRSKAVDLLLRKPSQIPPPPSVSEARKLMNLFGGSMIKDNDVLPGYEELAFNEFPRGVEWSRKPSASTLADFKVLVIGAGLSGIAAAIQLKRLGIPYVGIDRQESFGGTWLWNKYPEARVDTLSYLFQYKFEKNYKWKDFFASREETEGYLNHVCDKHGIRDDFEFHKEVTQARWDQPSSLWHVKIRNKLTGEEQLLAVNAIISAAGLFSTPNLPNIPGISDYKGHIFHTTNWDHSVDYRGMRAAVIGTGSTGTQLTPALARACKSVTIFQRSPNWIAGYEGYHDSVPDHLNWLCDNMPYYWNWFCYAAYYRSLDLAALQVRDADYEKQGGCVNARNDSVRAALTTFIHEKMAEKPELIPKLIPKYAPLVRRLVVDNGFYDALKKDHVNLVTEPIDRIVSDGILTKDGVRHEFDMVVLGAGFQTSKYFFPTEYIGLDGVKLEDTWVKDGARSYLGMVMPGFPNFFSLYGPNHQPRGGSLYSWAEIWARYAVEGVVFLLENGLGSMTVKPEVDRKYQALLDEENAKLIWESEDAGYYVNEHGRQAVNMPWTTSYYHAMVIRPNPDDFILTEGKGIDL